VRDFSVAGRYARALFIVTERRKETVPALEDLKSVRDLLAPGSAASGFLASPQVKLADKRRLLIKALEGRCARSVATFTDLLLRKKRLGPLPEITDEFEALVEHAQGIRRAHVVSAVALNEAEHARLHTTLESWTRSKVKLTTEVDGAVLGGAVVRIGDRVLDRTVRTLLEAIGSRLQEMSVATITQHSRPN
jgi:F-type H+-transporting ATPase subunit delta